MTVGNEIAVPVSAVAWESYEPETGYRWVTRNPRERDGWSGLGRTIRPLVYGDTPQRAPGVSDDAVMRANWARNVYLHEHPGMDAVGAMRAALEAALASGRCAPVEAAKPAAYIEHRPGFLSRSILTATGLALGYGCHPLYTAPAPAGPVVDGEMVEAIIAEMRLCAENIARAGIKGFGNQVSDFADRLAALAATPGGKETP